MVKFLKDKVLFMLAIIIILFGTLVYFIIDKINTSSIHQVVCTKEENDKNKFFSKEIVKYGKLVGNNLLIKIIYPTDDEYNLAKRNSTDDFYKYKFNDKKREIIQSKDNDKIVDEDGNSINMWYLTYIDSIKELGYVCK